MKIFFDSSEFKVTEYGVDGFYFMERKKDNEVRILISGNGFNFQEQFNILRQNCKTPKDTLIQLNDLCENYFNS